MQRLQKRKTLNRICKYCLKRELTLEQTLKEAEIRSQCQMLLAHIIYIIYLLVKRRPKEGHKLRQPILILSSFALICFWVFFEPVAFISKTGHLLCAGRSPSFELQMTSNAHTAGGIHKAHIRSPWVCVVRLLIWYQLCQSMSIWISSLCLQ